MRPMDIATLEARDRNGPGVTTNPSLVSSRAVYGHEVVQKDEEGGMSLGAAACRPAATKKANNRDADSTECSIWFFILLFAEAHEEPKQLKKTLAGIQ